jgi:hypothetical protein
MNVKLRRGGLMNVKLRRGWINEREAKYLKSWEFLTTVVSFVFRSP